MRGELYLAGSRLIGAGWSVQMDLALIILVKNGVVWRVDEGPVEDVKAFRGGGDLGNKRK